MAGGLGVERLYYLHIENKGADQLCGNHMQKAGFLMTAYTIAPGKLAGSDQTAALSGCSKSKKYVKVKCMQRSGTEAIRIHI